LKFNRDRRYIFSKEKFLENDIHRLNYGNLESVRYWVDILDDRELDIKNKDKGYINGYIVRPEWCIELIN
jgi:hypothetical protein